MHGNRSQRLNSGFYRRPSEWSKVSGMESRQLEFPLLMPLKVILTYSSQEKYKTWNRRRNFRIKTKIFPSHSGWTIQYFLVTQNIFENLNRSACQLRIIIHSRRRFLSHFNPGV